MYVQVINEIKGQLKILEKFKDYEMYMVFDANSLLEDIPKDFNDIDSGQEVVL